MIDRDELLKAADLSMLSLDKEDEKKYLEEINRLLELIEEIREVDTEGVPITYNVNNMVNPLREDQVKASFPREEILKNTLEEQYGYFKILRVME